MILAHRPHLQGLVLGALMLAAAAAGLPATVHAAQDLFSPPTPIGKVASADPTPKLARTAQVDPLIPLVGP